MDWQIWIRIGFAIRFLIERTYEGHSAASGFEAETLSFILDFMDAIRLMLLKFNANQLLVSENNWLPNLRSRLGVQLWFVLIVSRLDCVLWLGDVWKSDKNLECWWEEAYVQGWRQKIVNQKKKNIFFY